MPHHANPNGHVVISQGRSYPNSTRSYALSVNHFLCIEYRKLTDQTDQQSRPQMITTLTISAILYRSYMSPGATAYSGPSFSLDCDNLPICIHQSTHDAHLLTALKGGVISNIQYDNLALVHTDNLVW